MPSPPAAFFDKIDPVVTFSAMQVVESKEDPTEMKSPQGELAPTVKQRIVRGKVYKEVCTRTRVIAVGTGLLQKPPSTRSMPLPPLGKAAGGGGEGAS
jgi:hypothetical protein